MDGREDRRHVFECRLDVMFVNIGLREAAKFKKIFEETHGAGYNCYSSENYNENMLV